VSDTENRPRLASTVDPIAAARLVVAIGAFHQLHGHGPSWRQAARAAGWRWRDNAGRDSTGYVSDELADRMHMLRRAGLIVFTRDPRSLDVTVSGRKWALATLTPTRAARQRGLT
jgi:hypothetical protein